MHTIISVFCAVRGHLKIHEIYILQKLLYSYTVFINIYLFVNKSISTYNYSYQGIRLMKVSFNFHQNNLDQDLGFQDIFQEIHISIYGIKHKNFTASLNQVLTYCDNYKDNIWDSRF